METLSLKCACGYIKHDVLHIGVWQNSAECIVKFCGGLFNVDKEKDVIRCKKCDTHYPEMEFHCSLCERVTTMPVKYRVAYGAGNVVAMKMSVPTSLVKMTWTHWCIDEVIISVTMY